MPFWRDGLEALQRPPRERHRRRPGPQVDHAHVGPVDAAARHAGAQRLGAGFLGGEALGVAGGAVGLALGAGPFGLGEDAPGEALAEAFEGLLDAADVGQVVADADDQAARSARASSIRARIRWMAGTRPVKIASPIRKWPM